jgi:hypothetical protein
MAIGTGSARVTVPSRAFIRPYSVLVPFRQCRAFSTAVHFGEPPRPPGRSGSRAWPVVLEDGTPTDDLHLTRIPSQWSFSRSSPGSRTASSGMVALS